MSKSTRRAWASALLLIASAAVATAQPAAPIARTSTFYTIKPDRVGDFLAAAREYADVARKNGGSRHFSLWASLTGDREYVLVRYQAKWADLDTPQDPKLKDVERQMAIINARIQGCVEKSTTIHAALEHDLSLPLPTDSIPPMARVLRTWVRPDKVAEFRALLKNELLPAARKAGRKLYSVSNVRFGGSNYEFGTVTGVDKWADVDAEPPMVAAMGGLAAYNQFLSRYRPLVVRTEYQMYRYLKDQSFTAN